MESSITKAVIPAAGRGRRLEPITNYLPKSMLPLGRKPVLHHIIDELKEASIEQIGIVARSNQTAIFTYFRDFSDVEFIIDDTESGPGGAVLSARSFVGDDDFVVIFADAPVKGSRRAQNLQELINIKEVKETDAVLSVYEVPRSEAPKRGVVKFEGADGPLKGVRKLTDFLEKPAIDEVNSSWVTSCRYVLSPSIFDALDNVKEKGKKEIQLTTAIRHLINNDALVVGHPLKETLKRYDTGNFKGYFESFKDFAEDIDDSTSL